MPTVVAPVSTRNRTDLPLMVPPVKKWPAESAVMTMRAPAPAAGALLPTLTGEAPSASTSRCPLTSTTASPLPTLRSLTSPALAPTESMRGCPSITSSALSPREPLSATLCAAATPAAQARALPTATDATLVAEVRERERRIRDLLADQRDRGLQVVALGPRDAH